MADSQTQLPSRAYLEFSDCLAVVPVAHNVAAFADEVRRAVAQWQPDCLALELPRPLTQGVLALVQALPTIKLLAWKPKQNAASMMPGDPGDALIEGARLALEFGLGLELVDVADAAAAEEFHDLPDDFALARLGLERFAQEFLKTQDPRSPTHRELIMASRIRLLGERYNRVLVVAGLGHLAVLRDLLQQDGIAGRVRPQWHEPEAPWRLLPVPERELDKLLREVPYTTWLYENFRSSHGPEDRFPMLEALQTVLLRAAEQYRRDYDEQVNFTEWRALFQFGRNLALVHGQLRPRLYELLMAAKACVNDDFGAICLEQALSYPPNHQPLQDFPGAPEQDPAGQDPSGNSGHRSMCLYADFGGGKERLCHAYPFPELREVQFNFKRRPPTEQEKEQWRRHFALSSLFGAGICSWPPEDEFIENFFRKIRHRAYQQITEEHTVTEEFTSSMLEGLDVRETMRRFHEGKLFVKRERQPPGHVGPVVLIWRDAPLQVRSIWKTCLYAENDNESDLALYARPLGQEMVGPGITRTEYLGVLSVFPAAGIPDVWGLPSLRRFRTCARLLIASAIRLSEERYVAVVAARPPDAELRNYARQHGIGLIYLPLGTFSQNLLKRARQCHILAGKRVRQYASDYIPKI